MKIATPPARSTTPRKADADTSPILREIDASVDQLATTLRTAVDLALHIGLRLLVLHRQTGEEETPGGFKDALQRIEHKQIPRSTAYRWMNASAAALARHQGITFDNGRDYHPDDLTIPEPATPAFQEAEKILTAAAAGSSLRRLIIGSAATGEESRMDTLISASETGDPLADEMLELIAQGKLTLVQAIRAHAGAAATKNKQRRDPVYLDIDGRTGQPTGLFVRSMVTLTNTFAHWSQLDETARFEARKAWKALVSQLPAELR